MPSVPFYLDWKFWSATFALLAIVLSQIPPLRILLRRAKLEAEAFSRIQLFHKIGNPNASLHLILTNSGGRELRIRSIRLVFQRGTDDRFVLPAQGYLQASNDKDVVLLTPFKLKPKEDWVHVVQFFETFSRQDEKEYRQMEANLRQDIDAKLAINRQTLATADDANVKPLLALFNKKFRWLPGEYDLTLEIQTEPSRAGLSRHYRLTVFESDSKELTDQRNEYQHGFGVYIASRQPLLSVPLIEAYKLGFPQLALCLTPLQHNFRLKQRSRYPLGNG